MHILQEILRDFVRLMSLVDLLSSVCFWVLGVRQSFLMWDHVPPRKAFSLIWPLATEMSDEFYAHRRWQVRYMMACFAMLLIGCVLLWLDRLTSINPN
jgi:hypothetical protein